MASGWSPWGVKRETISKPAMGGLYPYSDAAPA